MKTTDNNKLIAEFMVRDNKADEKTHTMEEMKKSYWEGGVIEDVTFYALGGWEREDELKYDESWNWLMPVANEIIKSRDEQNADWDLTELKYALQTTNIELVYKAVVKFIKTLNKTK